MSFRNVFLAAAGTLALTVPAGTVAQETDLTAPEGIDPQVLGATTLPARGHDPMAAIDVAEDPVLSLSERAAPMAAFRDAISSAVARNPSIDEALANLSVADAQRDEARAGLFPDVTIGFQGRQTIDREFSNDPDNVLERSRSLSRYDATASVEQTILDFGATSARIVAATHRMKSAALEIDATAERVALAAVAAWYDVFAYRALVSLSESFLANQQEALASIQDRIDQGVNAPGDLARVESSIALTGTGLARYRRQLANAEARYTELIGAPPPQGLMRAPAPDMPAMSREMAEYLARTSPAVEAAQERARAAYHDSRATKADRLPRVVAGVDAGQYGIFRDREGEDYDVRARVSVQQRFFAGTFARADADVARADAAQARALGLEQEAVREALIAWADMDALEDQLAALSENYIASRRTRDVLAERFFYARGSLFDVLQAEDNYFAVAGNYIQALTERDSARYVLLARTGRLLDALAIPTQESAE